MVARSFFAYDNNSMLINGNPATPIINNSDTPTGTLFTFNAGGGQRITLDDVAGGGTSTTVFEDDQRFRHTITDGGGLVANGTQVEAESLINIRAVGVGGIPFGPTITLTVFSQNGQTGNVWGFSANGPLSDGAIYIKVSGSNTGSSSYTSFVPCFVRGTRIRAESGTVPVEQLAAGNLVWTSGSGMKPIRWIGQSTVSGDGSLAPVLFRAGAIGNDRDLEVSPNHRMLVAGWQVKLLFGEDAVLVPAKHLVGLPGVSKQPAAWVDYFHILFDRHEIVEANGVLSGSFYPGPVALNGVARDTRTELLRIFPELADEGAEYGDMAVPCLSGRESGVLRQAMLTVA